MLKERVLSAVVMILLVIAGLFLLSPLPFFIALAAIVVVGFWEWSQFAGIKQSIGRVIVALVVAGVLIFSIAAFSDEIQRITFIKDLMPFLMMAAIWWIIALALVLGYPKSQKYWKDSSVAKFAFGFLTLIPFLLAFAAIRFQNYHSSHYFGIYLVLYLGSIVVSADTGAYFIGRAFGKNKLAPKLSPGKSIEGAVGGVLIAVIISVIFSSVIDIFPQDTSIFAIILLSLITALVSILGDLTESMFKREAKIKDSSNLIPGHGGVLDRIDSLTAAAPIFILGYLFIV